MSSCCRERKDTMPFKKCGIVTQLALISSSSAASAASLQHAAIAAPLKPFVCCARLSRCISLASGMHRVCTAKMAARAEQSGGGTSTSLHVGSLERQVSRTATKQT